MSSAADHLSNIGALLARYEAEFASMVANPNAPAEQVVGLLNAITALRAEKLALRLQTSKTVMHHPV